MYFQGYLTELEKSSDADENVELSLKFGVNGAGVRGDVTVTESSRLWQLMSSKTQHGRSIKTIRI